MRTIPALALLLMSRGWTVTDWAPGALCSSCAPAVLQLRSSCAPAVLQRPASSRDVPSDPIMASPCRRHNHYSPVASAREDGGRIAPDIENLGLRGSVRSFVQGGRGIHFQKENKTNTRKFRGGGGAFSRGNMNL
ncbi:hypothetical protein F2P81_011150 [Scophthalmus maximus]|uniref:Secreted protein n=1 Tax=Scophthalmus maximus TaxID=52904 RepID=A0A6A4SUN9_SCOMX|nr:hypothetical protein F2P81_011150 [Scophthalmus maximus]